MHQIAQVTVRVMRVALALVCLSACSLAQTRPAPTPLPTPAIPQARILFPAHNQQVAEGVIFDIEIHASDHAAGVKRVELYVDERLHQTSERDGGGVPIDIASR